MKRSILIPALHTLWQAFVAAILMWWTASGLAGVKAVHSIDDAKRFALSALLAVLAALGSALMHTIREYLPTLVRDELTPEMTQLLDSLPGLEDPPQSPPTVYQTVVAPPTSPPDAKPVP